MSDSWRQWEGRTVAVAFPLLRYLGGSQRGAVFFTERREHGRTLPAAIRLVPSSALKAELRLSRWKQAASLSHPQLIRLYDSGRFELDNVPLVYQVMELADENLGQVLTERPLTPDETRAMLESVLDVVGYLHSKGFVHGHIKPSSIMAIGDQLKISSDRICRAGEPLENPGDPDEYDPPEYARGIIPVPEKTATAADVWSIGITVVEALTGVPPAPRVTGESPIPAVPENLPQPFAEIASHCLRPPLDRWKAGKIADCLAGRVPVRTAAQAEAAAEPVAAAVTAPGESAAKRSGGSKALVTVAVLAVAVAGALGWVRYQSRTAQSSTAQVAQASPAAADAGSPAAPQPQAAEPSAGGSGGSANASAQNAQPASPAAAPRGASSDATAGASARSAESKSSSTPPLEPQRPTRAQPLQEAVDSSVTRGDVARQVLPNVSHSSLETIQGTVKVRIKVDVDPSGGVSGAEFESEGPSKYFAREAMQAAQGWKFKPAEAGGREVPSAWVLQFEFSRSGAKAVPTQAAP